MTPPTKGGAAPDSSAPQPAGSRLIPSWFNRNLIFLFIGRALRSVTQGYLAIIVPIFLAELGYNAVYLGVLFTVTAAASALLAAAVGMLSDRFGRKTFLALIPLLTAAGGLTFAFSSNFIVLVIAAAVGTIGRGGGAGSGGGFGPYFPAAQALITEQVSDVNRTTVFGWLSFVGVLCGAVGSLLAWAPGLMKQFAGISLIEGYRTLFVLTAVLSVAVSISVVPVREIRVPPVRASKPRSASPSMPSDPAGSGRLLGLSRESWWLVRRFMATNFTNGLAIGMVGPFMVYWFYRRYGASAAELGQLFFVINLLATVPYLMAGRLAAWLGTVKTIVVGRGASTVLLAVMVFMPTFVLAASLYAIRILFNTIAIPVRQSYLMGLIPAAERSSAAGFASFPTQVGSAISPTIAGYLMEHVWLGAPLEGAAFLFGLYTSLYHYLFHDIRPPEELAPALEEVPR